MHSRKPRHNFCSNVFHYLLLFSMLWLQLTNANAAVHDIPDLTPAQLQVDYWLARSPAPDQLLRTAPQIQADNAVLFRSTAGMFDFATAPQSYTGAAVHALIAQSSQRPQAARFYADGRQLSEADFSRYQQAMALPAITAQVPAKAALVTSRGSIRTFPTLDRVFNQQMDFDIDRFQETAVFPGQALQVLHYSQDKLWAYVRHYHYNGWLQVQHLALTDHQTALDFTRQPDFLLVTGARVFTNFNPQQPQVSEVALEMGVRLPLLKQLPALLYQQNPAFSYAVQLPVRQHDGTLALLPALISRNQDVQSGYLPLTRANIIRQSFKFLGERYGWGHDYNARDCSGFINEVFKTFGLLLPRNTGSLADLGFGAFIQLEQTTASEKQQALEQADIGDLLMIPGHVMLILGRSDQNKMFVIHAVNGLSYFQQNGDYYHSKLNGVSVTQFTPLQLNPQTSYQQALYQIKSLSRETYAHR